MRIRREGTNPSAVYFRNPRDKGEGESKGTEEGGLLGMYVLNMPDAAGDLELVLYDSA